MKTKLIVVAGLLAATGMSQAAISIVGTFVTGLGVNAPLGTLTLLVADITQDGFLGNPAFSGELSVTDDPKLDLAICSTDVGATFGGDLVLGRLTVPIAGTLPGRFDPLENGLSTQGKGFALVWFPGLAGDYAGVVPANQPYGITRGTDWILPNTNSGETYTISTQDSEGALSFFRVVVSVGGVATNDLFTTSTGAVFSAVPETSAALLGALGSLGLLRRRR